MEDLVAWFRGQLEVDERRAPSEHFNVDDGGYYSCPAVRDYRISEDEPDCACGLEERRREALAEVDAKRRVVDLYEVQVQRRADNAAKFVRLTKSRSLDQVEFTAVKTHGWELAGRCDTLEAVIRVLAVRYAGRDGYREEWQPFAST